MTFPILAATLLLSMQAASPSPSQSPSPSPSPVPVPTPVLPRNEALPPSDAQAKAALDSTPRHGEYFNIDFPDGKTKLRTFVVFPERKEKAPVVIVIHEVYGLSDWLRGVADQLAKEGFIAVAPDLISGLGPGGGGTESLPSRDDVVNAIRSLTPADATARLDAVLGWALKLPSASGRSASIGFCWGGARSFAYATTQPRLDAAVVYYGAAPDSEALATIKAPVLGLYGGDDERVNATIEPAKAEIAKLGKSYEYQIYDGAGHGFVRAQGDRNGANLKAIEAAWPRTVAFLRKYTEGRP